MKTLFTLIALVGINLTLKAQDPESTHGSTGSVSLTYNGTEVTYTTVRAKDGRIWLQQNIGSSRVATTNGDSQAYGDPFNWGRWDDGHQKQSPTSAILPSTNNPSGLSKTGANPWYTVNHWWAAGTSTDTWTGASPADVTASNGCDPCKQLLGTSWSVPSEAEFSAMLAAEGITNRASGFASNLKITHTGYTGVTGGTASANSMIWTSTAATVNGQARAFFFTSDGGSTATAAINNYSRSLGFRLRCIKLQSQPVNFIDFKGENKNNYNKLFWFTASEANNSHFNIYKSIDGKSFNLLTAVKGKGTTNEASNYSYTDMALGAEEVYYKLEQVDFDGTTKELKVITVKSAFANTSYTVKVGENELELLATSTNLEKVKSVKIYSINGTKLAEQKLNNANKIVIAKNLAKGVYVLHLLQKSGKIETIKFVK